MTPIITSLSPLFEFQLTRNISGTDFGTGYGGTVCGFGLNIFISENNIHGNYNYCYIHKHNRIRTKAI